MLCALLALSLLSTPRIVPQYDAAAAATAGVARLFPEPAARALAATDPARPASETHKGRKVLSGTLFALGAVSAALAIRFYARGEDDTDPYHQGQGVGRVAGTGFLLCSIALAGLGYLAWPSGTDIE
jgi:hypothetical protein